ncbi:MAG: hypothetical protein CME70_18295 [Halobacteriovorax sp.]|nr:hypothetical protein [Halobacteriovorax sp.]|tara:strand:+ start:2546 stop:2965 length:420 start_codon:yes stop_codon:yes gene_type:complete
MLTLAEKISRAEHFFHYKWTREELLVHRGRLLDISEWLSRNFPSPYPYKLSQTNRLAYTQEGIKFPIFGQCSCENGKMLIQIHSNLPLHEKIETLLHEWAHAHTWRHLNIELEREEHDDEFYLVLGRIERAWENAWHMN